jgi:apolipoprotein N-acyltransferase
LLTLSFPKYGHPAFAWMALTPLIIALVRQSTALVAPSTAPVRPQGPRTWRRAFFLGLLTGAGYFSGTLYWLVETMTTFGGLPTPVALLVAALLVAYLSLFPAAFAVAVVRLQRALGVRSAILCAAPIWVATELGRQYVWDGFPWALLGYSQVTVLPIAQLASVTGVYGLSFLLALTSATAALIVVDRGKKRWTVAVVVAGLVAGSAMWGRWRIAEGSLASSGDTMRVAVVQGNIAQDDKWNPAMRDRIIGRYLSMTRQAVAEGATFVIWPESSFPVYFQDDLRSHLVTRLARETGTTLLVGSDQIERVRPGAPLEDPDNRLYNAAYLVKPDGSIGAIYRKMQLVPFGEYVPLRRILFFIGPIVEAVSSFTAGERPVLLPVGDRVVNTAICYEVVYGNLIRRMVRDGSELLTTITNDAWYGWSSAAYQHWDQAAMRAIENGRYLARAANTGVSGFVDPYGRVLQKSKLFEDAVLVDNVRLRRTETLYTRGGDLIAWISLAFTAAALLATGKKF